MKKTIILLILLVILVYVVYNKDELYKVYNEYSINYKSKRIKLEKNKYYRNYDFNYVQNTDNFKPTNRQDILNIIYTSINAGVSSFTFYCPTEYESCLDEIDSIASDQGILSDINNYVHPYNTFKHVETKYDSSREITISMTKNYQKEDREIINAKVDEIFNALYKPNDTKINNIRRMHDYIINNSKYDSDRSDNNIVKYRSDIAYGPLIEKYALCGGYSDAMQLFLEKMNIKSFKVSSEEHVWNAVELDGKWYNLDLTWDDPITNTGQEILSHTYFLINTPKLKEVATSQHNFNEDVYSELKA
ncbi:MAG: hypothetical protein IJI43_02725 [Bacilli bacterium]|nr:hypothetical protein [Bacilli bacterium]